MLSQTLPWKCILTSALSLITVMAGMQTAGADDASGKDSAASAVVEHTLTGKIDFVANDGTLLPDLRGLAERTLSIPATGIGPHRVVGSDNRTRVTTTTKSPWAPLCYIEITAGNGSTLRGSGVLIGPKTVLTSGITVYDKNTGGWARQMKVYPGRNGANTNPFGYAKAISFKTFTGWTQSSKTSDNIGAIILDTPIGNKAGWYGVKTISDSDLTNQNQSFYAYGYPTKKSPDMTLWGMSGRAIGLADSGKQIKIDLDVSAGQFGCPLFLDGNAGFWLVDPGWAPYVIGVVGAESASSNPAFNVAARITNSNFGTIKGWIQ